MPNWWDNIQNGLGQVYMPNYGSLDPQAQQAANRQAMMQLGAGLLANSTKRPGEALGRSLGGLQQSGMQAMQAQAMAETMNDRRDERKRQEQINSAWGQYAQKLAPGIGIDPETLTAFGPQYGMQIIAESRKGTGRWMTDEEKKAQGLNPSAPIWIGADGTPKGVGGGTNITVQGSAPAPEKGYRNVYDENGLLVSQEPIPGGPIDRSNKASAEGTARTANVVLSKTKQALDILEQYPNATTGLTGKIAGLKSDSPAAALQNAIGTIQSNIGFAELKRMRAESPTGGALGNVTIGEIERLERVLGDLKTYQDPRILRENLIMVENLYQQMVDKIIQSGGDPSVIGAGGGGFQSSNRGNKADVLSDDALFQKYGVR